MKSKSLFSKFILAMLIIATVVTFTSCQEIMAILAAVMDEEVSHSCVPVILKDNPLAESSDTNIDTAGLHNVLPGVGTFSNERVIPLTTNGEYTVENLTGQNLFLVRINTSSNKVQPSKAGIVETVSVNARGASSSMREATPRSISQTNLPFAMRSVTQAELEATLDADMPKIKNDPKVEAFNAKPLLKTASRNAFSEPNQSKVYTLTGAKKNDTGKFWIQRNDSWVQIDCTLQKIGTYCKIWVENDHFTSDASTTDDGLITSSQVDALVTKFDAIYPLETSILGYEYGGGASGDGDRDDDKKVQILVFQYGNRKDGKFNGSGVVGYFWGKDYYSQDELAGYDLKTNYAEIFYMDSDFTDKYPSTVYSTLAHEFQHMIHFNQKAIIKEKNSATWYNEMMSLMTEDLMAKTLGHTPTNTTDAIQDSTIPEGHPIERFKTFNFEYPFTGIDYWLNDGATSYGSSYGFGAFLLRNYGGSALLTKLMESNSIDTQSITDALAAIGKSDTFDEVFTEYKNAYFFNKTYNSSAKNFDKYVTETNYDFYAFDPWKIGNLYYQLAYQGFDQYALRAYMYGPAVWDLQAFVMQPHSFSIHTDWGSPIYFIQKDGTYTYSGKTYNGKVRTGEYYTDPDKANDYVASTQDDDEVSYFLTGIGSATAAYDVTVNVTLPESNQVKMYLIVR